MKIWKLLGTATAVALIAQAPVSATCWSPSAVEAAHVRDFDTMLMVATLRCRLKGVDLSGDYNRFVRDKRAVLTSANQELLAQFGGKKSGTAALNAFDKYATALANSHGDGAGEPACEAFKDMAKAAADAPASRAALLTLAAQAGVDPAVPATRCSSKVALAR